MVRSNDRVINQYLNIFVIATECIYKKIKFAALKDKTNRIEITLHLKSP